jgi:hypothetical protein
MVVQPIILAIPETEGVQGHLGKNYQIETLSQKTNYKQKD